jgi:hypothetical protein
MSRLSCRTIGRAVVAALVTLAGRAAAAQPVTVYAPPFPARVNSTNSVTIGGTFAFTASPLTQNSQSGNLCSPGACYVGTLTTRGNRGWQLQVRLASNPATFYVNYVATTAPASAQAVNSGTQTRLNTTSWLTVATGAAATAGSPIGVQLNANKVSGNTGVVPTAAQLAAVLAWQVVAYP